MKTAIVFYSKHHGNTKKLIDAILQKTTDDVDLFDAAQIGNADFAPYDMVGFASGIYFSKFHKTVLQAAEQLAPSKKVFLLYTYGAKRDGYTKAIREVLAGKDAEIAGEYGCFGLNTFGPFKLIGGMAKGRPNQEDLEGAVSFYERLHGK